MYKPWILSILFRCSCLLKYFSSFESKQQKKILNSQAILLVHYLYILTVGHGKLHTFPSIWIVTLRAWVSKRLVMKACLYLLVIINITCQYLVCDAWKRIAMLLLLGRCRITQIDRYKRCTAANPELLRVTRVIRIIYSDLSWKNKLVPKCKIFSFFCLFSFK